MQYSRSWLKLNRKTTKTHSSYRTQEKIKAAGITNENCQQEFSNRNFILHKTARWINTKRKSIERKNPSFGWLLVLFFFFLLIHFFASWSLSSIAIFVHLGVKKTVHMRLKRASARTQRRLTNINNTQQHTIDMRLNLAYELSVSMCNVQVYESPFNQR